MYSMCKYMYVGMLFWNAQVSNLRNVMRKQMKIGMLLMESYWCTVEQVQHVDKEDHVMLQ